MTDTNRRPVIILSRQRLICWWPFVLVALMTSLVDLTGLLPGMTQATIMTSMLAFSLLITFFDFSRNTCLVSIALAVLAGVILLLLLILFPGLRSWLGSCLHWFFTKDTCSTTWVWLVISALLAIMLPIEWWLAWWNNQWVFDNTITLKQPGGVAINERAEEIRVTTNTPCWLKRLVIGWGTIHIQRRETDETVGIINALFLPEVEPELKRVLPEDSI